MKIDTAFRANTHHYDVELRKISRTSHMHYPTRPYPTLPLCSDHIYYPTLPCPAPPRPYPTLPNPTLPYATTLPYTTLPCSAPTLPYPTLPYPTLPYPTLPYPTLYFDRSTCGTDMKKVTAFRANTHHYDVELRKTSRTSHMHNPTTPYPTLPLCSDHMYYPTLPYPTLPRPAPTTQPLPYPTVPYPTLPYATLPYPSLPYPTLSMCFDHMYRVIQNI